MTTSGIPTITYPTILVAVFANQLCLPVPAVLFLITAGALVGSGSLNFTIIVLVGVVGCLVADYAWFMAGRWGGFRVVRALCAFSANGQHSALRARTRFAQWGLPGYSHIRTSRASSNYRCLESRVRKNLWSRWSGRTPWTETNNIAEQDAQAKHQPRRLFPLNPDIKFRNYLSLRAQLGNMGVADSRTIFSSPSTPRMSPGLLDTSMSP